MIRVMWDSFCRAVIRFFDNRFVQSNKDNFYEIEISRLHHLVEKLLNERVSKVSAAEVEVSGTDPIQMGKAIETPFARRARLENESRIEWNKQLELAKEQRASKPQTIEELEKAVGI